jgi:hypothetical protein
VLIFNCTSGRSGVDFLSAILQKIEEQLAMHSSLEKKEEFFAKVIFCSNVTYASGNFKGGKYRHPTEMQAYVCILQTLPLRQSLQLIASISRLRERLKPLGTSLSQLTLVQCTFCRPLRTL